MRPHDVEIFPTLHENTAPAVVNRIVHLGWEIQVELALEDGHTFTAVVNRERFDALALERGQRVYVKTWEAKVFAIAGA
ncbi:MAG: hypothetical protein OHK0037_38600 [Elainellaceae cyanobacterium]